MRISALQSQKNLRDLHRLNAWEDGVDWIDTDDLLRSPHPAIIVGTWFQDDPEKAKRILAGRSSNRAVTLVVPRLPNLNFQGHLGAPVSIKLKLHDYDSLTLGGREFAVPGHSIVDSPLSTGRWGETGDDCAVLAWRVHQDAGWIIFCTASAASRGFGLDSVEQLGLLHMILEKAGAGASQTPEPASEETTVELADLDSLVAARGGEIAPLLLARLAAGNNPDAAALRAAAKTLGISLNGTLELQLPEASPAETVAALKRHGWGAYVRRVNQIIDTAGKEGTTQ